MCVLATLGLGSLDRLVEKNGSRVDPLKRTAAARRAAGKFDVLTGAAREQEQSLQILYRQGYYDTIVPPVIQRNILANPGWYRSTPCQSRRSRQGGEALLNFQTMVADLTGLPLANSSLLDERPAAIWSDGDVPFRS